MVSIKKMALFELCGLSILISLGIGVGPVLAAGATEVSSAALELREGERLVTLLATNDLHGSVEGSVSREGQRLGGLPWWAGVSAAIESGLRSQWGSRAGVLRLDGGDQFQGTLLSNWSEGALVFDLLSALKMDAVVPGNHDYDFGPEGWLRDQAGPGEDPRGALKKLAEKASFPLLSANTFFRDSFFEVASGRPLAVENERCRVRAETTGAAGTAVDWTQVRQPEFLKPYVIREVAGVRVALIGIDHPATQSMTTPANVSDLCFADEVETLKRVIDGLKEASAADVFVVLMHQGNSQNEFHGTEILRRALDRGVSIDAVVAGHTHFVNHVREQGVPLIQSGANGQMFGRIDLIWSPSEKRVLRERSRSFAGIRLFEERCAREAESFCSVDADGGVFYEGARVSAAGDLLDRIRRERQRIAPLAERVLGSVQGEPLTGDRTAESPLANALTDALRKVSGAEVALLNTGGLRAPLPSGGFTYEDFFRVLPFNNRSVILEPMSGATLLRVLERSIRTCGAYGALMQSGLRVRFEKDCARANGLGVDAAAKLLRVETVDGEVIFDEGQGVLPSVARVFRVATLDFLAAGGAGYRELGTVPLVADLGILRERLAEAFLAQPVQWTARNDGRWNQVGPNSRGPGGGSISSD